MDKFIWSLSYLFFSTLYLIGQHNITFKNYYPGENGLKGNYHLDVAQDKLGFIWVGGQNGLQRFDGQKFQYFGDRLSHRYVKSIFVASDGLIWISTLSGLNKWNPETEKMEYFFSEDKNKQTLSSNWVEPIVEDGHHKLWIGSNNGLNNLDPLSGKVSRYYFDKSREAGNENRYYVILRDPMDSNMLWLGSHKGLQKFDMRDHSFFSVPIQMGKENLKRRDDYSILGMTFLKNGDLLIGTAQKNEVIRYSIEKDSFTFYQTKSSGSLSPHRAVGVYDLFPINDRDILVSAVPTNGVLDLKEDIFSHFDQDEKNNRGLIPSAARRMMLDRQGYLWVPTLEGVSRSEKPMEYDAQVKTRMFITQLSVNDILLSQSIDSLYSKHQLAFHQNNLKLEFCYPIIRSKNLFEYRLLGKTNEWSQTTHDFVEFYNLKGGEYLFEIRALEANGDRSDVTTFTFRIEHAWWRSNIFRGLVAALIFFIVGGFIILIQRQKYRENQLKSQFEVDLANVRMEALRAQMNPHFLFNTMNSINHFILKNETEEASDYLTKFARLIRQILNNSKSKLVPLDEELNLLKLYIEMEQLRFEGSFKFELKINEQLNLKQILLPPMLLQPYVENAIWHGLMHKENDRQLDINICQNGHLLIIKIKDNGVGREMSKSYQHQNFQKKSFGLQMTQDRIRLANQDDYPENQVDIKDLKDDQGVALGTEVILTIQILK